MGLRGQTRAHGLALASSNASCVPDNLAGGDGLAALLCSGDRDAGRAG